MTNPSSGRFLLTSIAFFIVTLVASARAADPLDPNNFTAPIKVACVGDSITFGYNDSPGHSYPEQLQALLGSKWIIKNYGVGGRTLLRKGDAPWWNEQFFKDSHALNPDAVVIMLGTNDGKPQNWVHEDEFYGDYKDLIESFKALPSKPHIWIMRPPPVIDPGGYGIIGKNVDALLPVIDKLAADENVGEIDIHGALMPKPDLIPDRVHPNDAGAAIIAQTVAHAIAK